jgi:Tol biopolymer transport system component
MSNDRLPAALRLCEDALAVDADARPAYLDAACRGDPALRREVESLLAESSRREGFLEHPPWAEEAPIPAGRRLGPYEVMGLIGEGGMGAVYRARDTRLGRIVAIKVIGRAANDLAGRERFAREARAIAALNHPHICALHDIGHEDDQAFLVMEHLEGETLASRLAPTADRRPPMKVEESLEYAVQIAGGLAAAHAAGIVHRDLKPSNVMLTPTGVKLLDFGLAKHVSREAGPSDTTLSMTGPTARGGVLGTVGYTSPEQARGEAVDARSDIFSFGCVLYEMLAGHQPFRRASSAETTSALLTETPPTPSAFNPAIPPSCDTIVLKALEKDRELRYQSGAEMRVDLLRAKRELTSPSSHGPGGVVAVRREGRPWVLAAGAAAVLAVFAALVAGGLALLYSRDAVPPFEPTQVTVGLGAESEPALSPDGNFLAYTSDESGNDDIWLVDLRSGSAVRRTDDPAADRHAAWLPNGAELLFVSEREGRPGVWRMPALAGQATPLIADADEIAVSPDGQQLAFARRVPPGETRIAVVPLADVTRVRFLTQDGDGRWDHGQPAWSPDGTEICYRAQMSLWRVPAAAGRARPVFAASHFLLNPAWSHDGKHIYFSSSREGSEAIWRVDVSGRNLRRVTSGTGPEAQPSISRDGRTLAVATRQDDFLLVLREVATGQEVTWSTSSHETAPALSPDGRSVFFVSNALPPNNQLWSLPLEAGRPVDKPSRLTEHEGNVSHPAVSPDGRWIAYFVIEEDGARRSVWIVAASGGQAARVTDGPTDAVPEWTADGRHLLFVRDGHVWRAPVGEGRAVGRATPLAPEVDDVTSVAGSGDGALLALVRTGEAPDDRDVWVMPADGHGPPRQITQGGRAGRVRWDGDGSGALFVTGRWDGHRLEMRRVSLADRAVTTVAPPVVFGPSLEVVDFSFSRDGRLLAFARDRRQGNIWIARARKGRF